MSADPPFAPRDTARLRADLHAEFEACARRFAQQRPEVAEVADLQATFTLILTPAPASDGGKESAQPSWWTGELPAWVSDARESSQMTGSPAGGPPPTGVVVTRDPTGIQRLVASLLDAELRPWSPQEVGAALRERGIDRQPKSVQSILRRMVARRTIQRLEGHGRYASLRYSRPPPRWEEPVS